jgi:hypothetical protein
MGEMKRHKFNLVVGAQRIQTLAKVDRVITEC